MDTKTTQLDLLQNGAVGTDEGAKITKTPRVKRPKTPRVKPATEHAPTKQLVDAFHAAYVGAYGTKPAIPPRLLRDVKAHVERTGLSEALARLEALFAGRGPAWLRPPFDLATFVAQYDKLVGAGSAGDRLRRVLGVDRG